MQPSPDSFLRELAIQGKALEENLTNFFDNLIPNHCRTAKLPDYEVWGGKQVFKQPYDIQGTEFYGFLVEGTLKNLQDLCDRALNKPDSPVEYRPLSNYFLISFDVVNKMNSIDQPDREQGYFSEQEMIVWVPTAVGQNIGPFFLVERIAWFVPYIFVSNAAALLAGREVYGFPKTIGEFQIPRPDENPDFFSMDTLMLKDYSRATAAEVNRLLEIKRINADANPDIISSHDSLADLMRQVIQLLFGGQGIINIPGVGFPLKLAEYVIDKEVPAVCLKQFRDTEDGRKACYQAIVELIMRTTVFHGGKLLGFENLGYQYELDVFKFASEPMIKDLGLQHHSSKKQTATVPVKLAFYLNFDFIVENGNVIWEKP